MRNHIGSTLGIAFGVLFFAGGTQPGKTSMLGAGLVMVIGSMAYRSAKKRGLGEVESSIGRQVGEGLAMTVVIGLALLPKDLKRLIVEDPVPNFIIPLWVVVAYFIGNMKARARLLNAEQTKKCPYCAEEIRREAVVCKHCGRDVPVP